MRRKADRDPETMLPLAGSAFQVLLVLADDERHGYDIMREVEARTEGQFRMGPGTLYGALKKMLADGLIEESASRPDPERDDVRRRYYRITRLGQSVASAEARRLAELVRLARQKKLLKPRTA